MDRLLERVILCTVLITPIHISAVFLNETLYWTSDSNIVYFQNGTANWIRENSVPSTGFAKIGNDFQHYIGTSYDYRREYIVFSDKGAKTISLIGKDLTGAIIGVFVYVGTSSTVGHVAVDWLSGNVYWADRTFGWIGLQALAKTIYTIAFNDKFKVIVDTYLDIPSGVAVHPQKRFLFWSDVGKQPKIERSNLDGHSRIVLVWLGIIRPISLAVDHMDNVLYWTDTVRGTVESCDFYGKNRKILVTSFTSLFYGIEVYKEYVIVSDQAKKEIKALAINVGKIVPDPQQTPNVPYSISMYSIDSQPWTSGACNSSTCRDICLTTLTGAKCECEDGYKLDTDQHSCIADTYMLDKTYLLTNGSNICALSVTTINSHPYVKPVPNCGVLTTGLQNINYITVNAIDKEVFFANETNFNIHRQRLNSAVNTVYTSNDAIKGLSYDWTTKELFWTEGSDTNIYKSRISADVTFTINDSTTHIFRSGIDSPRSLTIDPFGRKLFWIAGSQNYVIQSADLDNTTGISTIVGTRLVSPNRLSYSRRMGRLFWTDTGKIGSVSPDGTGISVESFPITMEYTGITTYKDYLMWLSRNSSGVYMNVEDRSNTTAPEREMFKLPYMDQATDIQIFDKSIQPEFAAPCVKDNGGCQHICIVEEHSSHCECQFGYRLHSDGKTCTSEPILNNFFIVIDELSSRIYQIQNSTGNTETVDIDTTNVPSSVVYNQDTRSIIWCDKSSGKLKISNVNGANETTLTTSGITANSHAAVDPSTGNIYFTKSDSIAVISQDGSIQKHIVKGLDTPSSIALHSKEGKLFWTETGTQSSIRQVNMDGTSAVEELVIGIDKIKSPTDVAVDFSGNAVIWCDNVLDKIEKIDLTTYQRLQLRENAEDYPVAIAVDNLYVYYIGNGQRTITRIDRQNGAGASTVISSTLYGKLTSLSIISQETGLPRHSLCSTRNGRCSKFCLPNGKEKTCACPDGVNLKDDEKSCVGDIICPDEIKNGDIKSECLRYAGHVCEYTCSEGYTINITQPKVTCGSDGMWNINTDILCTKISCSGDIKLGRMDDTCHKSYGDVCGYTCNDGYKKNNDKLQIMCQSDGTWNVEGSLLCNIQAWLKPSTPYSAATSYSSLKKKISDIQHSEPESGDQNESPTGMIIGIVVGAVVCLVFVVVIIILCLINRVRKERHDAHNPPPTVFFTPEFQPKSLSASQQSSDSYFTSPERRRHEDNESVYDEIQERPPNNLNNQRSPRRKRKASDRYSSFPGNLNQGVDYLDLDTSTNDREARQNSCYLNPSSITDTSQGADNPVMIDTSATYLTPSVRKSLNVPDPDYE